MTRIRNILLFFIAIASLSGCKLGQRYQRPDLHMPQEYMQGATDTLAEISWWELYSDPCLQALIHKALDYNKDILASEARIGAMGARKRASIAQFFPSLIGQAYAEHEGLNYGGSNYVPDPEHGFKMAALWELDLWGGKRWKHDKANAQWLMSIELLRGVMVSVISDVAMEYYQLVALDAELQLAYSTLSAWQQQMTTDSLMRGTSEAMELAYGKDRLEMLRVESLIPYLERDIKYKENELSFLTGQYPGDIVRSKDFSSDSLPEALPNTLSAKLLERRPDIRAAEQNLIAANAEVGIAYTNRFPSFSLLAIGGLESDELKTLLKSPMHLLLPTVYFPVFDLGKLQSEYKASKFVYNADVQEYEKVVLAAFQEVSDAICAYNKCRESYTAAIQMLDCANATLALAQSQYQSGQTSHIELIDAQRSLVEAQASALYAARDKRLTIIALYKALGGGWQ